MNLAIAVIGVLLLSVQVFGSFNCNRDPYQCQNNSTCSMNNNDCNCVSGTSGYDCSVIDSNINGGDCNGGSYCENGGVCHHDGVAPEPTCLCPVEYISPNCSSLRYNLICEADNSSMTLEVTPLVPNFVGTVFVEGAPSCSAEDAGNGLRTLKVNHTSAECGDAEEDPDAGTYTRCFYVIYNNMTFTSRDQKICAVCGGDDTIGKSTGNLTIGDIDGELDQRVIGDSPVDADVGIKLMRNGVIVSGNVVLGEELKLLVYLTERGAERFQAIRVERSEATNNMANGQERSALFIENSCPSSELSAIVTEYPNRTDDKYNVSYSFEAFRFIYGGSVTINVDVKTCKLASDCDPLPCSPGENPPTGVGRKKRQAETGETEEKVLTATYTIGVSQTDSEGQTFLIEKEPETCPQTLNMTAAVIALAVALFLVLLLCLFLIAKNIINRKTKMVYKEDSSVSSSSPFPNLPRIVPDKS